MALFKSDFAKGAKNTPTAIGSELVATKATYTLTGDLSAGDIIQMMDLPANMVPVDIIADWTALGAGTIGFGMLNESKTDLSGTPWLASTAVTNAGAARAAAGDLKAMQAVTAANSNRALGVKVLTDTTATSGSISITLLCRAA